MKKLLVMDPAKRMDSLTAISHPYFDDIREDGIAEKII